MTKQQLAKAKLLEEAIVTLKSRIDTARAMKADRGHFELVSDGNPLCIASSIPISDLLADATLEAAKDDMEQTLAALEKEFSEL